MMMLSPWVGGVVSASPHRRAPTLHILPYILRKVKHSVGLGPKVTVLLRSFDDTIRVFEGETLQIVTAKTRFVSLRWRVDYGASPRLSAPRLYARD